MSWTGRAARHPGAVISLAQCWELAKRWYDDRLDLGWHRRSPDARQAILNEVGLTGPFWLIPEARSEG